MGLSSSVIRIVILVLPGIISALLYWRLRGRSGRKDWEDFLEIGVFSLLIYLVYSAGTGFLAYLGFPAYPPKALEALTNDSLPIPWSEIPEASLIGVALAVVAAYADKYNSINWLGRRIKASNRLNDKDIWETFFHHPKIGWVYVTDHKADRLYFGWVQHYSDTEKARELVLKDVKVYCGDDLLYETPLLYCCRDNHDLTIEFPPETLYDASKPPTEEVQVAEKRGDEPAVKIVNPSLPKVKDELGESRKGQENTNRQTPRPDVQPTSRKPPPKDDGKK